MFTLVGRHLDLSETESKPYSTAIHHGVITNYKEEHRESGSLDGNNSAMYLVFLILHDPALLEYKDIYPFSWLLG